MFATRTLESLRCTPWKFTLELRFFDYWIPSALHGLNARSGLLVGWVGLGWIGLGWVGGWVGWVGGWGGGWVDGWRGEGWRGEGQGIYRQVQGIYRQVHCRRILPSEKARTGYPSRTSPDSSRLSMDTWTVPQLPLASDLRSNLCLPRSSVPVITCVGQGRRQVANGDNLIISPHVKRCGRWPQWRQPAAGPGHLVGRISPRPHTQKARLGPRRENE